MQSSRTSRRRLARLRVAARFRGSTPLRIGSRRGSQRSCPSIRQIAALLSAGMRSATGDRPRRRRHSALAASAIWSGDLGCERGASLLTVRLRTCNPARGNIVPRKSRTSRDARVAIHWSVSRLLVQTEQGKPSENRRAEPRGGRMMRQSRCAIDLRCCPRSVEEAARSSYCSPTERCRDVERQRSARMRCPSTQRLALALAVSRWRSPAPQPVLQLVYSVLIVARRGVP